MTGAERLGGEPVKKLLDYFGITHDPIKESDDFLKAIDHANPRSPKQPGEVYKLRHELAYDQTEWPIEAVTLIEENARSMGMYKKMTCPSGHIDLGIVLGGANKSNHQRLGFFVSDCPEMTCSRIVMAGSSRLLSETEVEIARRSYGIDPVTEFDLCVDAVKRAAEKHPHLILSLKLVDDEGARTPDVIRSVLKSSLDSGFLARNPNNRICACMNQIYACSLEYDLARVAREFTLPLTCVAGCPSDEMIINSRTTATYLTEVYRTIEAAVRAAQANV